MRRLLAGALAAVVSTLLLVGLGAAPASAHVLPTTTVVLDVRSDEVDASLRIPLDDLEAASGIDLGDETSADVAAESAQLRRYLLAHFSPSSDGREWSVTVGALGVRSAEGVGTGQYTVLTVQVRLVPPTPADERSFDLGYDVVVHRVITHTVIVSERSDWSGGQVASAREVGTIALDPVSGTVGDLHVDLGEGSLWRGTRAMLALGIAHIREGTDHQLFLLTLLLPAPLLVAGRRWAAAAPPARAVRRIAATTGAFALGHSATLALGALGLSAPQQWVEVLVAASILVAAVHAVRPVFAGREVAIAAGFGLVHGMAFSATLTGLDLSGSQLVVSLLGFNLGIELMQLAVVALVLPPLCVLARTRAYTPLRLLAAALTGVAAAGWVAARLGVANPVATAADGLGSAAPWVLATLWGGAAVTARTAPASHHRLQRARG